MYNPGVEHSKCEGKAQQTECSSSLQSDYTHQFQVIIPRLCDHQLAMQLKKPLTKQDYNVQSRCSVG